MEYLRALHLRFSPIESQVKIDAARREMIEHLDKPSRRALVHLLDLEQEVLEQETLRSFTQGLKLGLGLMAELREDGFYSFAEEEEERACRE